MGRSGKAAVALIATVVVLVFFLAPVTFWFNLRVGPAGYTQTVPVYRSLGCAVLGLGDLYAPEWFGFSFGCGIPVPIPSSRIT